MHHQPYLRADLEAGSIASLVAVEGRQALPNASVGPVESEEPGQDRANHHAEELPGGLV